MKPDRDLPNVLRPFIACLLCAYTLHDDVRQGALLSCPAAGRHKICQHLQAHEGRCLGQRESCTQPL